MKSILCCLNEEYESVDRRRQRYLYNDELNWLTSSLVQVVLIQGKFS